MKTDPIALGRRVAQRQAQQRALMASIMRAAHSLWPVKPGVHLALLAGASPRTADRWRQNRASLTSLGLANLLRSEHGFHFLAAIMAGNNKPTWWRLVAALMGAAEAQRLQAAARNKLRELLKEAIDADRDLSDAIARTDALLAQDQDFYRAYLDALRAQAGDRDCAVDQSSEVKKP